MCGIVGYLGEGKALPVLLEGLMHLEYRGYDSAGVALLEKDRFLLDKREGKVRDLKDSLSETADSLSNLGIGHTRWATHGVVNNINAHPHLSSDGKIALVHNGVIENCEELAEQLRHQKLSFKSETDTEILLEWIAFHYAKEPSKGLFALQKALATALKKTEGTWGLAILCADTPALLVGACKGSALCLGLGSNTYFLASDVSAFLGHTREVIYLEEEQLVFITPSEFEIQLLSDSRCQPHPTVQQVDRHIDDIRLEGFESYMEKEIFQQAASLRDSMRGRLLPEAASVRFGGLDFESEIVERAQRILFLACGSSRHACLLGEYLIERYARIPVEVEYASEFRYRNPPIAHDNTLIFGVSQSGETLDTLEALKEAKRKLHPTFAITNTVGSSIAREVDMGIYQHAGPEISVASTKAFSSQVLILSMLALKFGRMGDLPFEEGQKMLEAFQALPDQIESILSRAEEIKHIATHLATCPNLSFLGRQLFYPVALEGALKLKEISYLHAEAYPAGEMKHGPLALIDPTHPSIVLALDKNLEKKLLANIQEIHSRGGPIFAIVSEDSTIAAHLTTHRFTLPPAHPCTLPILANLPLQLLAYYIATELKRNVDQPRNLAKSVTVE